jgi:hypothetical protein
MQALQPLTPEERERVLQSAAALFSVSLEAGPKPTGGPEDNLTAEIHEKHPAVPAGGKRLSVVEFLNEKQPATNAQRIACFAYYREHIEGKGANFSRTDVEGYFAVAKLPKPGNYDRDWRQVVREGWIHDEGANSYLTRAGEESVQAGFGGRGKPRGGVVAKRSRKTAKKNPAVE